MLAMYMVAKRLMQSSQQQKILMAECHSDHTTSLGLAQRIRAKTHAPESWPVQTETALRERFPQGCVLPVSA
jgi:hypothetical protein